MQLREDVADVAVDRPRAQHELLGDRLVRAARGHEPQDLELPRAQAVRRRNSTLQPVESPELVRRPQRLVGASGGGELEGGGVLVAERGAGTADELP